MITRALIRELHCPSCGSALEVRHAAPAQAGKPDALVSAVVACECCRYPVIDGILILQQGATFPDRHREAAVRAVEAGDRRGALQAALLASDLVRRSPAAAAAAKALSLVSARLARRYGQRIDAGLLLDPSLSFEQLALALRPRAFADYLVQRFANPSFLAAIPGLLLLGEFAARRRTSALPPRPRLIDLGAGAGHASLLLTAFAPAADLITTDSDFISLCLAGRLLGPSATIMGLDAEAPLPFADGSLDAAFSLDAYHYMRSKIAVARELRRTVRPDGLWVFPHLHNALARNPTPGVPLTPAGYARCFAGIDARLYDEAAVLRAFVDTGAVDLTAAPAAADLSAPNALLMVGSAAPGAIDLWRRHDALAERYISLRQGLGVNPLYAPEPGDSGQVVLRRAWASESLQRECAGAEAYLPERATISADLLRGLERGDVPQNCADQVRELLRSFILVPLPGNYRARTAAAPASSR